MSTEHDDGGTKSLYDFEPDAMSLDELRERVQTERKRASKQMEAFDPDDRFGRFHYWQGRYGHATQLLNLLDDLNELYGREP
jgi:hypothetical protein